MADARIIKFPDRGLEGPSSTIRKPSNAVGVREATVARSGLPRPAAASSQDVGRQRDKPGETGAISLRAARALAWFAPRIGAPRARELVDKLELLTDNALQCSVEVMELGFRPSDAANALRRLGYFAPPTNLCAYGRCRLPITADMPDKQTDPSTGTTWCSMKCLQASLKARRRRPRR